MPSLTQIFLLIVAFSFALGGVYLVVRRIEYGFYALLFANFYNYTFGLNSSALGRLHLDFLDAVSIILLLAGAIRTFTTLRTLPFIRVLSVFYLLLFLTTLIRGFQVYGIFTTSNESRGFVGPLLAILYFFDADLDEAAMRNLMRAFIAYGVGLCCVAALATLGLPIGQMAWAHQEVIDGRYLPAAAACGICLCAFISLSIYQYRKRGLINQLLPILFVAFVVYLRHRTVWMMLIAGCLSLVPIDGRLFRRFLPFAFLAMLGVTGFAVYQTAHSGDVGEEQFADSASNTSTLLWRVNSWFEVSQDVSHNALNIAIGEKMGSGYWRIDPETHTPTIAPPHSEYIQQYSRVGILGLLCILGFLILPIFRLWTINKIDPEWIYPSVSIWMTILCVLMVYGLTYNIDTVVYAFVGLVNGIVQRTDIRPQPAPSALDHWSALPLSEPGLSVRRS